MFLCHFKYGFKNYFFNSYLNINDTQGKRKSIYINKNESNLLIMKSYFGISQILHYLGTLLPTKETTSFFKFTTSKNILSNFQ